MSDFWTKTATNKGGDFEQVPPGNYPAALVAIVDLGGQENDFGGEKKIEHRVFWCWELVTKKTTSGKNFLIGIDLTYSLHEKAKMRKWIEARLGKSIPDDGEYSIKKELGQKCLLSVKEKKGYSKIEGVASIPDGITVPDPVTTPFIWSIPDLKDNKLSLPSWLPFLYGEPLTDHIKRAEELQGTPVAATATPKNHSGAAEGSGVGSPSTDQTVPF